jgi:O-antigen ligase/tetratricopeptide (TPR) repeat protein
MSSKTSVKIINYALYALLVAVPLIFIQRTMYPFVVVKTVVFQSLAEVIIFLWAALAIFRKECRPRLTPLTALIFILFGLLTISSFLGADWRVSLWSTEGRALGLVSLWHFAFLYLALASLKSKINWRTAFLWSLAASAFASLGALLTPVSGKVFSFFLKQDADLSRPGSTFGNPSFLAGYLLFNVFLGIWLFYKERGWTRWFGAALALLDALGIMRSQTRGDIAGLFLGIFIILLALAWRNFKPFNFKRSLFYNPALLALVAGVLLLAVFSLTKSYSFWQRVPGLGRFSSGFSYGAVSSEIQNRLIAWRGAWLSFLERPVLGWGWENFNIAFERHYDPLLLTSNFSETFWDKPHNILVEYAVSGGALGILAYLGVFAALIYEIFKSTPAFREKDAGLSKSIWLAMFAGYLTQNLVLFDTIGTYLMAFFLMAYLDCAYTTGRGYEESNVIAGQKPEAAASSSAWFLAPLLLAAIPIYFMNVQIFLGVQREYGGPNFYLLRDLNSSLDSLKAAVKTPTPYQDYALLTLASVVKEAYTDGIIYPDLANLQKQIVDGVRGVIERHPQNYFYYTLLADLENSFYKFDQNYLRDAEALEQKALELSPKRQQVYYVMAKTKLLEGDRESAMQDFQTAIDLNPDAGDPHFYFGILAYESGDAKKGAVEIQRAKELGRSPKDAEEAIALGDLAGDVGNDYEAAIDYYKQAEAMSMWSVANGDKLRLSAELKLATAYYLNGDMEQARTAFRDLKAKGVDFLSLPSLKPVLEELGVTP